MNKRKTMRYLLTIATLLFVGTASAQVTSPAVTDIVLRSGPNPTADTVAVIPSGADVTAHEAIRTYLRASYDGQEGYVHNQSLRQTDELAEFTCEERWNYMSGGSDYVSTACNGRVVVGMPEILVRAAWGEPADMNSTETENSRQVQWVYNRDNESWYVYVENGAVTAIQQ